MEPRETDPVLDALYEEGDAATDAASEVARFRDLRVALRDFRDATDQEPAGNMAILMAAARARTPAEPTGLWARLRKWFSVIAVHPAMAAAATVVVVGGVAGALYMNGRGQMVEPTAERAAASEDATASAPAIAGSGAASGWGSAAPTMDRFTAGSGSAAATPMTEKQAGTRANDLAEERAPDPRVTRAPAKPAAGASAGPRGGEADENASDDAEQEANEIAPRLEADRAVAEKPPALTVASDRPTEPAPAPPPPPPRRPAPAPTSSGAPPGGVASGGGGAGADKDDAPAPKAKDTKQVVELTNQARVAARRRDCKTVDALAGRVRSIDLGYYRGTFAVDGDIQQCNAPAQDAPATTNDAGRK